MRFVDLFAGLGGFHSALRALGHTCVFASEKDPNLRQLYARNFGLVPVGDIRNVPLSQIPEHEVLCAGFPCQPFSKAGYQRGLDCERDGDLFDHVVSAVEFRRPQYMILENVPNLARQQGGRVYREMQRRLRDLGYTVDSRRLSPHQFGIPQVRERLFIVASRAGLPSIIWPREVKEAVPLANLLDVNPADGRVLGERAQLCLEVWQEFLSSIPADNPLPSFPIWSAEFGATYPYQKYTPYTAPLAELRNCNGSHGVPLGGGRRGKLLAQLPSYARTRAPAFPSWKIRFIDQNRRFFQKHKDRLEDWLPKIHSFPPSWQKLEWNFKNGSRDIWQTLVQFRPSGIRAKRPGSAPSLVAMTSTQVPVVAWERRYLSPRECARLQSLDDIAHLPGSDELAFQALGNAVNATVVRRIAEELLPVPIKAVPNGTSATAHAKTVAQNGHDPIHESRGGGSRLMPTKVGKKHPSRMARRDGTTASGGKINIRPGVSVLSVLSNLNYQPWFALAEYVDNSLQSFISNRSRLQNAEGKRVRLKVDIELETTDGGRIVVRDNASGIAEKDYARAFRAAELPPDRRGLAEFGMGMKSASCFFAPQWTVRTKALGETLERTVTFDLRSIVRDSIEELDIRVRTEPKTKHYTEIVLSNLHKIPQKRTIGKMREHLASIYREFLRDGILELTFRGEPVAYEDPPILRAPLYSTPKAKSKLWRKAIDIRLSAKRRVHGFAALRETGSVSGAGFALLRRRRLIQGSADEGYRPEHVFGKSNSYYYQRLFGELHFEGFDVSYTKDGLRWEDDEEGFLEKLKKALDTQPLPLLQQANNYRSKPKREDLVDAAKAVVASTALVLETEGPRVLGRLSNGKSLRGSVPPAKLPRASLAAFREVTVEFHGAKWRVAIELTDKPGVAAWVDTFERKDTRPRGGRRGVIRDERFLGVRIALDHPFTLQFGGAVQEELEPLVRMGVALILAETVARKAGVDMAGAVRANMNDLLRQALSKP